jgi:hypothetical protein
VPPFFCRAVPLTTVQWFKGKQCLRANADYLRTCRRYRRLDFWEVHEAYRLLWLIDYFIYVPYVRLHRLFNYFIYVLFLIYAHYVRLHRLFNNFIYVLFFIYVHYVRLHQLFDYIDDMSILFLSFSEVNLMISCLLIYQTYHDLCVIYNLLVFV